MKKLAIAISALFSFQSFAAKTVFCEAKEQGSNFCWIYQYGIETDRSDEFSTPFIQVRYCNGRKAEKGFHELTAENYKATLGGVTVRVIAKNHANDLVYEKNNNKYIKFDGSNKELLCRKTLH